ncbi:lytic polysaccharide monooxygenase [Collimonas sp.]|jgi:chitin-binding protein|uniref:lytic polysaccharide monooxygenase n=1 Tax=Collimonas sp. TaxID=1963772 RepID=UPI002CF543C4|nr:lytic polysaccharide monooxygenase [Collimonas sp.]HWW05089.1 lytic polysaccharide monooxygenase [Collimonas sp.]
MKKALSCPAKLTLLLALTSPLAVQAHGYIDAPKSRAFMCKTQENSACGAIQYEPQSVEGPKGFPEAAPADGTIAAGGLAQFSELNAQTQGRWKKVALKAGQHDFTWYFTAGHMTQDWRYYITKQGWNPNQELRRDSFELTPFCIIKGGFAPVSNTHVTHSCNIPASRSGYHVILSAWNIADTGNAFYQVIDAEIQAGIVVNPQKVLLNPFR